MLNNSAYYKFRELNYAGEQEGWELAAPTADTVTERLRSMTEKIHAVAGLYTATSDAQLHSGRPVPAATKQTTKPGEKETVAQLVKLCADLTDDSRQYFVQLSAGGIQMLQTQASAILESSIETEELVRALPTRRKGTPLARRSPFAWQEVAQKFKTFCAQLSPEARRYVSRSSGDDLLALRDRAVALVNLQQQRAVVEQKIAARQLREKQEIEQRIARETAEANRGALVLQFAGNVVAARGVERARARLNTFTQRSRRFREQSSLELKTAIGEVTAEMQTAIERATEELALAPTVAEPDKIVDSPREITEERNHQQQHHHQEEETQVSAQILQPPPGLSSLQTKLWMKRQAHDDPNQPVSITFGRVTSAGAKLRFGAAVGHSTPQTRPRHEYERRLERQRLFDQFDSSWLETLETLYPAADGFEIVKVGRLIETQEQQYLGDTTDICEGVVRGTVLVLLKSGIWCPGPTLLYLTAANNPASKPTGELPLSGVACDIQYPDDTNNQELQEFPIQMRLKISEEHCPTHPLGGCEMILVSELQDGRNPDRELELQEAKMELEEWSKLISHCSTLTVTTKIFEGVKGVDGLGGQVRLGPSERPAKEVDNGVVRGMFFDIATKGDTQKWQNPEQSEVTVEWSSLDGMNSDSGRTGTHLKRDEAGHAAGKLQQVAAFTSLLARPSKSKTKFTCSKRLPDQWITFDLGARRRLKLLSYLLQHAFKQEGQLRHWKMQASSRDKGPWVDLSTHIRDTSLEPDKPFATALWGIDGAIPFRFFRLLMTGKNVEGTQELNLGAVEFYGELQELNDGAVFDDGLVPSSAVVNADTRRPYHLQTLRIISSVAFLTIELLPQRLQSVGLGQQSGVINVEGVLADMGHSPATLLSPKRRGAGTIKGAMIAYQASRALNRCA